MEKFIPSNDLIDFIVEKSNSFKGTCYLNMFDAIGDLNMTPEIEFKIDPTYLEQELLNIIVNMNDDDVIFTLDTRVKEILISMFKHNGIILAEDIPLYIIVDILEQYIALFNTSKELVDEFLNIAQEVKDGMCPTFTFCKLINCYSSIGMGNITYYISNVDQDVITSLLSKYEEDQTLDEKIPASLIQNIAIFNLRYKTTLIVERKILQSIKRNQLFNKPFEKIFPYVNEILNGEDLALEEYIDTLIIGYITSKEGYNSKDGLIKHLEEYGLIEDFNSTPKELIVRHLSQRINEISK